MNNILCEIKDLDIMIFRMMLEEGKLPSISTSQMRIIAYIYSKNCEVYQRDLEKELGLRRATLSGILNTMEKNKLLYRVLNGRTKKVVLTEKTNEIFKKKKEKMREIENILVKDISDDDIKFFIKIINKMKDNIKKECDINAKIN